MILFQDLVIAITLLLISTVLVGEYSWVLLVTRNPARWVSLSKNNPSENKSLYPGEMRSSAYLLTKRARGEIKLSSKLPYLKIEPSLVKPNEVSKEIHLDFKTPFSGEYLARDFELSIQGPLKLFAGDCTMPLSTKYVVFPKIVQVAITSWRILGRHGGIGETPINALGLGTEFHELREYQLGDDYRQINWKASARRNELIVNERMREVGGSYYLVLDSRAADYSERDRLASAFLHVANTLTMLRTKFGVVIHDGEKITALKKIDAPEKSLGFSLSAALEFAKVEKADLPEELIPMTSYFLKANQKMLAAGGYELLSEIEESGRLNLKRALDMDAPLRELVAFTWENESETPVVLYFSAMHGSIDPLLEVASEIKTSYRGEFTLIAPTMPWVPTSSEDEAYKAYTEFYAKLRAFEVSRIYYVIGEPIAITRNLFERH